ncbi:MAG: tetratricopeptide repeat protein, partial [Candidatus Omnitrophica bacterium]|nr:tetratricopeptide repeat protein [Candidatus Omnitrophota bacterium]
SLGNLPEMVPFLALVVLIIIFLRIKRSHRLLSFSFFWYLAALSPQFYARLNLTAAEHHAYPAYLAVYFILALALGNKKLNNIYIKYAAVFIILLFSLLTIIRNFEWRNENSLWSSSRRTNPRSGIASGNLGILLIKQGIYDEGKKYLEQASRFSQEESPKITSTLNLAYYYALNKEPQKGLDILTRQKEYLSQAKPVVYYKTLAYIYFQMGKVKEAQRIMQDLIRQFTESAELKAILGWFYLNDPLNKDKENARSYFEMANKLDPDLVLPYQGLGMILEEENPKQAIDVYKKGIKRAPSMPDFYYRLGVIYATKMHDSQALWYFKKVIELSPTYAPAYYNLALLYTSLESPDYVQAKKYLDTAKELGFKVEPKVSDLIKEFAEK